MSRNDQVTRQWMLLQRLENAKGMTLSQLAASLPEDYACHPRTIRRDLEALQTRFPLVQDRIDGEAYWKLLEGFRNLPTLTFSTTEVLALFFSRNLLKPLEGTYMKDSLDSAFYKVAAAFPAEGLSYVEHLQENFPIRPGPHKVYLRHHRTIEQITRAIVRQHTLQMRYFSASQNRTQERSLDPYRLWYAAGALYLVGYCHERKDVRMFAVDRIRSLAISSNSFQPLPDFDFNAYIQDAFLAMRGKPIDVELLFSPSAASWAKDQIWHPSQRSVLRKDGRLRMTLHVSDTPELLGWILHFASEVQVVRPESLREKLRQEARRILENP